MKRKKMICVIGLGLFGAELARSLAARCEVLAMDKDAQRIDAIADHVQQARVLDARDFAALSSVVTAEFDEAIVTLSESLEASILCTLHLKKIGVGRIWAKAASPEHESILDLIGADEIIFPERESAHRIAAQLENPNLLDFIPLAANYEILDVAPPDWFYGKSLRELDFRRRFGGLVLGVKELVPERFVFLPEPDYVVKPSDVLVVIGQDEKLAAIQSSAEPDDLPPADAKG